jgi:perosamine synthetase
MKMKDKIKLFDPDIGKEEEIAIKNVLKSGFWASGAGQGFVSEFENKFRNYIGAKDCIAVNSGTSALNLALSLLNIKNREVIVPSLTFVSTVHAITLNGGKPVFVDVDPRTLCLDVGKTNEAITNNTKVILPVHFAGMPCEITHLSKICKNNDCKLVEDAAHAAGATHKNKKIGTHGYAVCFSFHPVKNLAMPTGGVISINGKDHKKIKEILFSRRWCGITNRKNFNYDVKEIGENNYMNEFSAAIGLVQLNKLDKMNKKRKKIAKKYYKKINVEQKMPYDESCSYHIYWLCVKNRSKFMKKMKEAKIETGIHYKPIHKMTFYKDPKSLPVTEEIENKIVSIPIHTNLTNTNVDYIIKKINESV